MPCIRQITAALQQGQSIAAISSRFHYTLVQAFAAAAVKVSRQTRIRKIVLSGGGVS